MNSISFIYNKKSFHPMIKKKINYPITCFFGICLIIIYCIFLFISVLFFSKEGWSPINTWLSDFGNSDPLYNPIGAIFFNLGCIITGILLIPFYFGLYRWFRKYEYDWKNIWIDIFLVIAIIFGICSGISLFMLGIYSEDFLSEHIIWSRNFFNFNLLGLFFIGLAMIIHKRFKKIIVLYAWTVVAINLSFLFFMNPLLEWFTVFTALIFGGLVVYNTFIVFKKNSYKKNIE